MLDKLKFNNMIISNAKVIQKVRIQIVRKIIQKMRKLKDLIEKRPGDQNTIIKQRKCVAIVERVKKIKKEDVVRNILLLEKNPNKIVTNSQSTPEEVAIAMLASNKTMQELAQRFRQELNLNEAEAESWKKTLLEIGKLKEKKQRRKKRAENRAKQAKIKERAETKGNAVKQKTKPSKRKTDEVKLNEKPETEEASTNHVKPELETSPKKLKPEVLETKVKAKKTKYLKTTREDDDEEAEAVEPDIKPTKAVKVKNTDRTSTKISKAKAEPQLKYLTGFDKLEELPRERVKTTGSTTTKPVKVGVVDPFFLTETGEAYIANIELKEDNSVNEDCPIKAQKEFGRISKRFDPEGMGYDQYAKKSKPNLTEGRQNFEDLHPSWAAKKKQSSISDFRGKKITFGEDSAMETTSAHKSSKETPQSDLHPSWAAKQKLKPTITAFQGKKITFGDDE